MNRPTRWQPNRAPSGMSVQARYDAAGNGRRIAKWAPPTSGPNRAIDGLQRIRDRARDTTRNDWAGASGVQKWVTALVGVGITPRWKTAAIGDAWGQYVPHADADGTCDAYGLQTLAVRAWIDSGEVFMRRRPRSINSQLPAPVQVQVIEADFVPLFDTDQWPGMPQGNRIRQGIELNRLGKRIAYWMYREHPGDGHASSYPGADQLIRVLASDVSHVFEPKRPGQLRGVSNLAPVLVRLRNTMDFEDAVLDKQKLANLFVAFVKRALPEQWDEIEFDAMTGLPKFYNDTGTPMVALEPGIMQELRPGEDVTFANPPEAGTTFSEYMRTSHMGTAAGAGLPYELFAGDIKDISDRTLRVVVNEWRRLCEQLQWQIVIPRICAPMVTWWAEAAVLSDDLSPQLALEALTPTWTPHGWPDLHPTQDIEGRIKARDAGFTSTSAVIARTGDDPRQVQQQIEEDKASGLTPPVPARGDARASLAGGDRPHDIQARDAGNGSHDREVMLQMSRQAQQVMATQAEMFGKLTTALSTAMSALGQQPVHVAAPTVVNNIEPAKVDLSVDVNLPERRIETDLMDRDEDGLLRRVVQTERTVK